MRFHGKVALITGGAAGIGAATAELMVSAGGKVLIADLREELAKELVSRHPGSMIFVALDVRSEESWVAAIAYCEATYGRLDVLVNCAGVSFISGQLNPENITIEEWRAVNSVNVEGTILGCKHAIPALRRTGGGAIVNLSSIGALIETSLLYAYGASKAAVSHVTKSVASYCAKNDFNIRCNAVLPGPTETEMYRTLTDAQRAENARGIPIGYPARPIDIANAILFLSSDDSRYITGVQLSVDGGLSSANPMRSRGPT